jgi:choline dehydrogenase-like flavoprotein
MTEQLNDSYDYIITTARTSNATRILPGMFKGLNAWGHHASCSCRMGRPEDPMAVVDSSA